MAKSIRLDRVAALCSIFLMMLACGGSVMTASVPDDAPQNRSPDIPDAEDSRYFVRRWRECPGEPRPDVYFPESIGAEVLPTPEGKKQLTRLATISVPPYGSRENSGLLTIYVPADTKVFINGHETRSVGSRRRYVCYGLKPGFHYEYDVHAEVLCEKTGFLKEVERKRIRLSRTVVLSAGDKQQLAFTSNVVIILNTDTGEGEAFVLDDELKRTQQGVAGARRYELESRPKDWLSPP